MEKKIIFHIDVNSAFLSWTAVQMLKEGNSIDIRKVPSIIGGDREKRHGIVLAKSMLAKKYKIVTGEPIARALEKCKDLIIVPPNHSYYEEQSGKFIDLLTKITPDIEQVSIDECYMDFSGIENQFESYIQGARYIKDQIKSQLGFTVNIGISDIKVLAKMASDFQKPDRIHTLFHNEINEKMWPLPVEELFMAGYFAVDTFHKLGIYTIGELAISPMNIIEAHLKSHGKTLWEYANGIDKKIVNTQKEELKGIGNSTTLPKDLSNVKEVEKILLQLSEKVSGRLRNHKKVANTIAVEIKYSDFTKCSKQKTIDYGISSSSEIYQISKELFKEVWNNKAIRLLGIRTANLKKEDEPEQLSLLDIIEDYNNEKTPSREKMKQLEKALDTIKNKYGKDAISRASLLDKEKIQRH